MTYNIQELGSNTILGYYDLPVDAPVFLGVFKVPCYDASGSSKNGIIPNNKCGDNYEFIVIGVAQSYEDLSSGSIYFSELGTWEVDLYYQTSTINTDPDNATFLETVKFQVNDYTAQ